MSKKKILVIEDEDICVTLLNLVINVENFDVFVARNGEDEELGDSLFTCPA